MNCLKINNRDPIEYLSGKGLLRKVSVPCKYIYFFLAFIYIYVRLVGLFSCLLLSLFVLLCV